MPWTSRPNRTFDNRAPRRSDRAGVLDIRTPKDLHRAKQPTMPTFEVTHEVEMLITHRVEAATADEANAIAVELSVDRTRQLEKLHKDLGFGPVNAHWVPPKQIAD